MAYIELTNDSSKNNHWTSVRLAVGTAMFITYFLHYIFIGAAFYYEKTFNLSKKHAKILMKKIYLFGIGCLISMNYLQSGNWAAIASWFTGFILIMLHMTILSYEYFKRNNVQNFLWVTYYLFIFVWYLGVMSDFYVMNN